MRTAIAFAAAVCLLAAAPARAQTWEASGLFGLTLPATIDERASELSDLAIRSGFTWGVQAARFFTPSWGAEVLWTQQGSALELGTADGKADLFTMTVRQLHGNLMYRFGGAGARWQPFVFGGLGATFLSADTIKSETKLSLDVGGGLKYFPRARFGARTQIRYKPSLLNDSSSGDFCDPFGFCQGVLQQIELTGGVVVRF